MVYIESIICACGKLLASTVLGELQGLPNHYIRKAVTALSEITSQLDSSTAIAVSRLASG